MELCIFIFVSFTCVTKSKQYENLALGKAVTVSTRYNNRYFDPSLAVDDDVSTELSKCTLTSAGQNEAWLTVDLGEVKSIASVSFLHGGFGQYGTNFRYREGGIFDGSPGNSTVRDGFFKAFCPSFFTDEVAGVVCFNAGFLPEDFNRSEVQLPSFLETSDERYACTGNEIGLTGCKHHPSICFSRFTQIFLNCKSGNTLVGFSIYVSKTRNWTSGTPCFQHDINKPVENSININCSTTGRYVTIYNSRNSQLLRNVSRYAYINICELNVMGCDVGHYSDECKECPSHCRNNTCHIHLGYCFECKDGYTGQMCENECSSRKYGRKCSFHCGNCLNQETCDHINGSCPSACLPGWTGDRCDQKCENGHYGFGCSFSCNNSRCLISTKCEAIAGQCDSGCINRWYGPLCEECDPTFYGEQCNIPCSDFCQSRVCNQTSGQCLSCVGSRTGSFCEHEMDVYEFTVGIIVTCTIVFTVIAGIVSYFLKRKYCPSSEQKLEQNYELPLRRELHNQYADLQNKTMQGNGIDSNTVEYCEIAIISDTSSCVEYANVV